MSARRNRLDAAALRSIPEVWDLDLDGYNTSGIDLVYRTALDVRRALRPVEASDILVAKVMLGVFGCVPAFDTYFKKGFRRFRLQQRVSSFGERVLSGKRIRH